VIGQNYLLSDIPNMHLLCPEICHISHTLWDGKLLLKQFINGNGSDAMAWVCDECHRALFSKTIPKFALANNLWIGNTPHELAMLTLPEQLLVARHYVRCYVVKLYPRSGYATKPEHLQRGISGNVTLYDMNTDAVVRMLEGQLLPQPATELASVLGVTYIGTRKLPKTWLKSTFRVRRRVVYEALMWLKEYNHIYHDVVICPERLSKLPEDDIPLEILGVVRHEANDEIVEKEREGYVIPDDSNGELYMKPFV